MSLPPGIRPSWHASSHSSNFACDSSVAGPLGAPPSPPGSHAFRQQQTSTAACKQMETRSVLLALIGQEWLDLRDSQGGRRLDDANDFVRIELASALRRDTPVVPEAAPRGAASRRSEAHSFRRG